MESRPLRMRWFLVALALLAPPGAAAQTAWGNLGGLLWSTLAPERPFEDGGHWLPDTADPATASEAVGIVYPTIQGAAGNVEIVVGHFRRQGAGWILAGRIAGIYGTGPREILFHPDRIELTTTMPNPGDPRCCPTGQARWAVDRATLAVRRVE